MLLKLPKIIIKGFCENNVSYPKYIDIYEFQGDQGERHGPGTTVHFLFIIKEKTEKIQEHDLY